MVGLAIKGWLVSPLPVSISGFVGTGMFLFGDFVKKSYARIKA